jgi:hypothetical protein
LNHISKNYFSKANHCLGLIRGRDAENTISTQKGPTYDAPDIIIGHIPMRVLSGLHGGKSAAASVASHSLKITSLNFPFFS